MWYLTQSQYNQNYGVLEAPSLDSIPTRICRDQQGRFGVTCLSTLTKVVPEEADYDLTAANYSLTVAEWLIQANVIILETFESDNPLADLPSLFPEYYI